MLWDHLVATWLDRNLVSWEPLNAMRAYLVKPLGNIQDFGFVGVALFFLISGFIITHVATSESRRQFVRQYCDGDDYCDCCTCRDYLTGAVLAVLV